MVNYEGHFFYSYEQELVGRLFHNHINYCEINNQIKVYSQMDTRHGKWFSIFYRLGLFFPNKFTDCNYLGYGRYSHAKKI